MMDVKNYLWCEKYRPRKIAECVLPDRMKSYFQKMVESGNIENMTFVGSPGTGKTTVARALCEELGIDYILINASENGNIDTIRTTVKQFASSISLSGGVKCIILDEADGLTCFTGDTTFQALNSTGEIVNVRMDQVVNKPLTIKNFDFNTNSIGLTEAIVVERGEKEVFEVTLDDGRTFTCTSDHRFFDANGNEVTIDIGAEIVILDETD